MFKSSFKSSLIAVSLALSLSACGDKVYNRQQKNVTNVSETKSKIKNTQVSRDIRSTTSLPNITYDEVLQKVKLYSDIDFFKDGKPNDEYIAFLKNDIRINFSYMRSSRTSLA